MDNVHRFPGLPIVPQFLKMVVELVLLEFVGITANGGMRLASVELAVPVQETS